MNGARDKWRPVAMTQATMNNQVNSDTMGANDDIIPKEISLLEFVECRARELEAMMQAVSTKVAGGNRTPMQMLPRHMRRRAANHDVRRLPLSRRLAAKKELDARPAVKRKPPSRRHRRRPSNLLAEYARRKRKHVWLETHIWHAKRFHMADAWGYRLPNFPNDRGTRAVYRDSVKRCVLLDMSYLCCIELCGLQSYLVEVLSRLTSPDTGPTIGARCNLSGSREGHTVLYHVDAYPRSAIGEVSFMWRPATDADSAERRTLWIWTHPSCHDEVFAELSGAFSLSESDCRTYPVAGSGSFGKTDVVQKEVEANGSAALKRSLLADNVKDVSREAKRQKLQEERVDCDITSANHVETGNSDCRETSNIRSDVVPCTEIVKSEAVQAITALPVGNRKNRKKLTKSGKKASKTDVAVPLVSKMALTRKVFDNGVVSLESLKDDLCRFRLIGPTSHSILSEALSLIDSENILPVSTSEETKENVTVDFQWWKEYYRNDGRQSEFHDQEDCWKMSVKQQSATDFPMHCILSLIVRDPRLFLPVKRTHASLMTLDGADSSPLSSFQPSVSASPIWDRTVRDAVKLSKMSTSKLNEMRSRYLVPGTLPDFTDCESRIPVLLIQRPSIGGRTPMSGNPGYGSGWDVILPTNWAMPFWIALVYRGAKAAGLRDLHSLSVEAGNLAFPDCCPDTAAASETSRRRSDELRAAYERRPPAKRCNYEKLGVAAPFHCPWSDLVRGWSTNAKDGVFYCLRSRKWLLKLAEYPRRRGIHASKSSDVPLIGSPGVVDLPADPNCCIVQITIRMLGRGVPSRFALICLPSEGDLKGLGIGKIKSRNANAVAKLVEPIHSRPTADAKDCTKSDAQPTAAVDVVNIASRRTFGFVVEGGFSHALGYGFGIGFVAFPGLMEVLQRQRPAVVLIRTTSSLHYHAAELSLIV